VIVHIMTYERSTLVNSEKYIGLDVHQATISVAVMPSEGWLHFLTKETTGKMLEKCAIRLVIQTDHIWF
jgi:hypothetical protein